jgi:hypothetical protein
MFDVTLHQSLFDTSHSLNFILKIYDWVPKSNRILSTSFFSLFFFLFPNKSHIYSFILDSTWGTFFLYSFHLFFIFHFFMLFLRKKRLIFMWQVEMGCRWCGTLKTHLKNWNYFILFLWFLWAQPLWLLLWTEVVNCVDDLNAWGWNSEKQ